MKSFINKINNYMNKTIDGLKLDIVRSQENLRVWIHTHLFNTVSLLDSLEFTAELARIRGLYITRFLLWFTTIIYRIEHSVISTFNRKGK